MNVRGENSKLHQISKLKCRCNRVVPQEWDQWGRPARLLPQLRWRDFWLKKESAFSNGRLVSSPLKASWGIKPPLDWETVGQVEEGETKMELVDRQTKTTGTCLLGTIRHKENISSVKQGWRHHAEKITSPQQVLDGLERLKIYRKIAAKHWYQEKYLSRSIVHLKK